MQNIILVILVMIPSLMSSGEMNQSILYQNIQKVHLDFNAETRFLGDAYNYRIKNNLPIHDFYYDRLLIDNPNTPSWAKTRALPEEAVTPYNTFKEKIPLWILKGQLMNESSSEYNKDGSIKYVNRKRGGNNSIRGGIGPFQVLRIAFDHMKKEFPAELRGERYDTMQTNLCLNEKVACMYLWYIYNGRGKKNWNLTIMKYNVGPWGNIDEQAREYLRKVIRNGN